MTLTTRPTETKRIDCSECNGTGGARGFYDYVRQESRTEFCWRCDGHGYREVAVFNNPMRKELLVSMRELAARSKAKQEGG